MYSYRPICLAIIRASWNGPLIIITVAIVIIICVNRKESSTFDLGPR